MIDHERDVIDHGKRGGPHSDGIGRIGAGPFCGGDQPFGKIQ